MRASGEPILPSESRAAAAAGRIPGPSAAEILKDLSENIKKTDFTFANGVAYRAKAASKARVEAVQRKLQQLQGRGRGRGRGRGKGRGRDRGKDREGRGGGEEKEKKKEGKDRARGERDGARRAPAETSGNANANVKSSAKTAASPAGFSAIAKLTAAAASGQGAMPSAADGPLSLYDLRVVGTTREKDRGGKEFTSYVSCGQRERRP